MQICSKRTVRQKKESEKEFAVNFVNFGCHNNYFRPGPRLLYPAFSFNGHKSTRVSAFIRNIKEWWVKDNQTCMQNKWMAVNSIHNYLLVQMSLETAARFPGGLSKVGLRGLELYANDGGICCIVNTNVTEVEVHGGVVGCCR